jgi:RNA polymerase sigma-70 factor (ECF subfamily)
MPECSDRDLVQQAQRGDGAAVGELFSRYWRAARAAAFGVTGEFASAEDAAAEAFREALAGISSLRDPDRFGSWLRTIAVRKARLGLQSSCPAIDDSAGNLSDPNERPDQALARLELEALVRQAMRELPGALRETLALVYFEGYDSRAAARFLDIPPGTLRRRLHDGRACLRKTVEQLLRGKTQMNEERERKIQRLSTMIDKGEIYQVLKGALALRPVPSELIEMLVRRQLAGAAGVTLSSFIGCLRCQSPPPDAALKIQPQSPVTEYGSTLMCCFSVQLLPVRFRRNNVGSDPVQVDPGLTFRALSSHSESRRTGTVRFRGGNRHR